MSNETISDLTFVVFTYNEAARIGNVIRNFRAYGPILVVDNFSTDGTADIARQGGCEVLSNKNPGWVEDFETTERVQAAVGTDWLYWGFADEIAPRETLAEVKRVIEAGRHDVICIQRKNYLYGQFCQEIAASAHDKVFKKGAIDFRANTIHNFGRRTVKANRIYEMPPDKFFHHLISNTVGSYLDTINRYTDMEITTKSARGVGRSRPYYLLAPLKAIWGDFFFKGGRRAGQPALSLSALMMIYGLVAAMKGWESSQGLDRERIAGLYRRVAEDLLREFPE